jgi:hypothetical protein
MASTYTLISSQVLASSAASVTFSSIPATYTDLVLRMSTRMTTGTFGEFSVVFNSDSSALYSNTNLYGSGSAANSYRNSNSSSIYGILNTEGSSQTGSTFSNNELYIPNYTASQSKPVSAFGVTENNATTAYIFANAGLYRSNTAINSITIIDDINTRLFATGSSFYLYGISNA